MKNSIKVLVLGISGMLGSTIFKYLSLSPRMNTFGTLRNNTAITFFPPNQLNNITYTVDAQNFESLEKVFQKIRPDFVINCIGVIQQIDEGNNPLTAIPINALLPHYLADLCHKLGSRLIHFSTDCVFSGHKGNYKELDLPDATDVYGRTKLLGEVVLPPALTLRTSMIGHELVHKRSLLAWFLAQDEIVTGYEKAIFSGLPTIEIASIVEKIILNKPDLTGLYHVAAKPISKYELLSIIKDVYQKTIYIKPSDALKVDKSLDAMLFNNIMGYTPPEWPLLVQKMRDFSYS